MEPRELFLILKDTIILTLCAATFFSIPKYFKQKISNKSLNYLALGWILFWCFEYYFLGSASYIHYYDEADGALVRYLADLKSNFSGDYIHYAMGGMDHLGQQITGGQRISLEKMLLAIFPVWIAILIHKILLVSLSFAGLYLLLRKMTNLERLSAFLLSTTFTVLNPYIVYSTIHHGLGYAILPMAIYLYIYRSIKKNYFLITTALSFLIAISTIPTHSLMATGLGIVLSIFLIKSKKLSNIIGAASILLILVLANWAEVLFSIKEYSQFSSRVIEGSSNKDYLEIILGSLTYLWGKTEITLYGLNISPFIVLSIIVIFSSLIYSRESLKKYTTPILLCIFTPSIIYLVSKYIPAFSILNSINFNRLIYFLPIPITLLAAKLTQSDQANRLLKKLPLLFLMTSLLIHLNRKNDAIQETLLHNQKLISKIPNLKNPTWAPPELFRVVTSSLPYISGVHPNFLWSYGIDTLDGYSNLVPKTQIDFWHYGIHQNVLKKESPNFTGGNLYISYGEENLHSNKISGNPVKIKISQRIDLNLLRLLNVSHIVSSIPLDEESIQLVSGPTSKNKTVTLKEKITQRLGRLFEPENVYIYSLGQFTKRIYLPTKLIHIKNKRIDSIYREISKNYCKNCVFSENKNLPLAEGLIKDVNKIKDGYSSQVNLKSGGLVVLNAFYLPSWKIIFNNQELEKFPINGVQIGVIVPKGKGVLNFLYKPNKLFEVNQK